MRSPHGSTLSVQAERNTPDADTHGSYWISAIEKSIFLPSADGRILSLVFSFSRFREVDLKDGLRLILVSRSDSHDGVTVANWHGRAQQVDCDVRLQPQHSFRQSKAIQAHHYGPDTFTILLECVFDRWDPHYVDCSIVPLSTLTKMQSNLRILFDQTYPPDCCTRGLVTRVHYQDQLSVASSGEHHRPGSDSMYLSIIHIDTSCPHALILPPDIAYRVAEYATVFDSPFSQAWNENLFSIATISKAWAHAFDLRWKNLGTDTEKLPFFRSFEAATAALNNGISPSAARYLKGFNMTRFVHNRSIRDRFFRFAAAIIKHSSNLLHLNINADIFFLSIDSLSMLQCIRDFDMTCKTYGTDITSRAQTWTIIRSWVDLRSLHLRLDQLSFNVSEISNSQAQQVQMITDGPSDSYQSLEELNLYEGGFTRHELLQSIPSSGRLHTFRLYRVAGLTTADIWNILSLTHLSLVHLAIIESEVEHVEHVSASGVIAEYPLDTWMNKMKRLCYVITPGTLATLLSVARKGKMDPSLISSAMSIADRLSRITINYDSVSDMFPSPIIENEVASGNPEFLLSIIRQSDWDAVLLSVPSVVVLPPNPWRAALAEARKNGMSMEITGDAGPLTFG